MSEREEENTLNPRQFCEEVVRNSVVEAKYSCRNCAKTREELSYHESFVLKGQSVSPSIGAANLE